MEKHKGWRGILAAALWVGLVFVCIMQRERLTPAAIRAAMPEDVALCTVLMLLLFILKSILILIYSGVLYTAAGLLFPPLLAVSTCLVGTVLMLTISFYFGRRMGRESMERLARRHPRLSFLLHAQTNMSFIFWWRLLGIVPMDVLSMYLGTCNVSYGTYLVASLFGLLPRILMCTLLGQSARNMSPVLFIGAVLGLSALSAGTVFARYWWKKHFQRRACKK